MRYEGFLEVPSIRSARSSGQYTGDSGGVCTAVAVAVAVAIAVAIAITVAVAVTVAITFGLLGIVGGLCVVVAVKTLREILLQSFRA